MPTGSVDATPTPVRSVGSERGRGGVAAPPGAGRAAGPGRRLAVDGLACWIALAGGALAWGTWRVAGADVSLDAAPLVGTWDWHGGRGLLPAAVVGASVVAVGPRLARRAPWRAMPWLAGGAATAWTAALAAADGWDHLTAPLATRHEYEPFAATVGDLGALVRGFVDGFAGYPVHVQGHPPGPVVLAWALDRAGLAGAGWLAALALAGWGAAVAAALVTARLVAGEDAARRAGPALVVVPAAVWAGTSLDALFAAVVVAACALAAVAVVRSSVGHALAAGTAAGVALLCTYGAVAMLVLPAATALASAAAPFRRRPGRHDAPSDDRTGRRGLAVAAVGAALGVGGVLGAAAAAGFWWPEGLAATRDAYWAGVGGRRPGAYLTVLGNPGALALAVGPAVAVGLAGAVVGRRRASGRGGRRWDRAAVLPLAALVGVAVADLSQMSRGEVERIWLPFVPWLALAAPGHRRAWLAAQVALAGLLQAALVTPW